jgi:GNAT superfamily N-acetyltransferase
MYELRSACQDDYDFLYRLLVQTMKLYVEQTWGWDEAYQQERFRQKFDPAAYQIILIDGHDVGALAVERRATEMFLAEIQLLPEYQRRGLGTAVVQDIVAAALRDGLPMKLQVLKVNPARRLYERLGFTVTAETATHVVMRCD